MTDLRTRMTGRIRRYLTDSSFSMSSEDDLDQKHEAKAEGEGPGDFDGRFAGEGLRDQSPTGPKRSWRRRKNPRVGTAAA